MAKTPIFSLNRKCKTPLYELIQQNIRNLITEETVQTADVLPAEWERTEQYAVRRLAVRHALPRQGWLLCKPGAGNFHTNPGVMPIAPSKLTFSEKTVASAVHSDVIAYDSAGVAVGYWKSVHSRRSMYLLFPLSPSGKVGCGLR